MTDDLITLLKQSTPELEQVGSEMRTVIQTCLILIRDPVGIIRMLDDSPDATQLKRSLCALQDALGRAQTVVMKLMDKITTQAGVSRLLITDLTDEREEK